MTRRTRRPGWLAELDLRHGLDHLYALMVAGTDPEQREEFDSWLWSDPKREAEILAVIGRTQPPDSPETE